MSATNKKSCFLLQFFDCNSIQEKRRYNKRKYEKGEKNFMKNKLRKTNSGITLIALVITILFSYDEKIKCSNSKGILLKAI